MLGGCRRDTSGRIGATYGLCCEGVSRRECDLAAVPIAQRPEYFILRRVTCKEQVDDRAGGTDALLAAQANASFRTPGEQGAGKRFNIIETGAKRNRLRHIRSPCADRGLIDLRLIIYGKFCNHDAEWRLIACLTCAELRQLA